MTIQHACGPWIPVLIMEMRNWRSCERETFTARTRTHSKLNPPRCMLLNLEFDPVRGTIPHLLRDSNEIIIGIEHLPCRPPGLVGIFV